MDLQSESVGAVAKALSALQAELLSPAKGSTNPHFGSSYADLPTCWEAVRPLLSKHGLAVAQSVWPMGEGEFVVTSLIHESGEFLRCAVPLRPVPDKRGNVTPHAIGSAVTYARRYGLCALLGIAPDDGSDDDGNQASSVRQADGDAVRRRSTQQLSDAAEDVQEKREVALRIKDVAASKGLTGGALKAFARSIGIEANGSLTALSLSSLGKIEDALHMNPDVDLSIEGDQR